MADSSTIWPAGWHAVEAAAVAGYARQLAFEVGPGHVLHGKRLEAVAACGANDDVLFRDLAADDRFVVVHLTWTQNCSPHFPGIEHEGTLAAFRAWAAARCPD